MSSIAELQDAFYKRYQYPFVEELTLGYAGIDPPLKTDGTGLNHEDLDGLLGGDDEGHYHLTREQLEELIDMLQPKIIIGQEINIVADEEMSPFEIQITF